MDFLESRRQFSYKEDFTPDLHNGVVIAWVILGWVNVETVLVCELSDGNVVLWNKELKPLRV